MRFNLVFFVLFRYFKKSSSVFSIVGIAIGVMTLISVISVMDGFQSGFIETILEINSYHVRVNGVDFDEVDSIVTDIRKIHRVISAVPFTENKAIVHGVFSNDRGIVVRGVPDDIFQIDSSFASHLEMVDGVFNLSSPRQIVLGVELAQLIGVRVGDNVVLASVSESGGRVLPVRSNFTVAGIFKTGYYEIDSSWAFISLRESALFFGIEKDVCIGVKIKSRFNDSSILRMIRGMLSLRFKNIESWREYNRAFFNALLMEKIMMYLLLGLVFIVVGFNIYYSMKRIVYEKTEDIAIFRAFGEKLKNIRLIFILSGFITGIVGAFLGVLLGLFVSVNINEVFVFFEFLANGILSILRLFLGFFDLSIGNGEVALFSPVYFYLVRIPVRLYFSEVLFIIAFAVGISVVSAFLASVAVNKIRIAEIFKAQ